MSDDDQEEAQDLLLDAGFSTGHPEYEYALGTSQSDAVQQALEQLYSEVADHQVVIDDVDLGRPAPVTAKVRKRAVHPDRTARLATAIAAGERTLEEWDAVSDSLCDGEGWPLDDRYGLRQQQRDAEMWAQFEPYLRQGPPLLAHAEASLPRLGPDERVAARWAYRLRVLRDALKGGTRVQGELEFVAEVLLPEHPHYEETWQRAIALRNAEGWHYALTWFEHADALTEITQTERALAAKPTSPHRGPLPPQRTEAARAWSPHALQHINAALESSSVRPAATRLFRGDTPPRSR
ncbi:hypothetical protein GTW43_24940 [Streptomyces sp. SID5785]|uniref:hypothetical protein n=1 Tax=Streptomyces sp. SID5785 TaxID=2690309 RepID=UPI001361F445|nr:hypothetical protein [Streptomyces sp. SID5785]MZD08302.1 hypothetical protein [Streptomyces sp. SID5785]